MVAECVSPLEIKLQQFSAKKESTISGDRRVERGVAGLLQNTRYQEIWYLRGFYFPAIVFGTPNALYNRFETNGGNVTTKAAKKTPVKDKDSFGKDRRRRHHHWLVTVSYADGEKFGRVYTDKEKASRFAERQRRSPVVKSARISQVS